MLSEKYTINDFVEAIRTKTFADVENAISNENAGLADSEDPLLTKDYLKHMTMLEQKKFIDQRQRAKADYGKFIKHLRALMKDEKTTTLFSKNELGSLDTIFRNIAIAENPRCIRYLAALKAELAKQSAMGVR